MDRVVIESPFAGEAENLRYLRAAMADCFEELDRAALGAGVLDAEIAMIAALAKADARVHAPAVNP